MQPSIREKFKEAIGVLLLGEFSRNNETLWSIWRDYLHDIPPEDLPPKVRDSFIWCRTTIMSYFNDSVAANTGKSRYGSLFNTPEQARDALWKGYSGSWEWAVRHPLQGMGHKRVKKIKAMLFQVFAEL